MADELAGMCADLCMEQVEPEQALERIQEKALEQLVSLLDTRICRTRKPWMIAWD